jgi:hypothetical protein|tara:strand:+ start:480 stop:692 length:213 start_codon:yes stop_codon:yes gene_type:complete
MDFKKILEFYNNTTPEEKCQLLNMMARDISIPVQKEDGTHDYELCDENPVCMNGTSFQLNTKEFTKYCNS